MASKVIVGTPNTLGKVWNIDVEREYRKLSYLFQNHERNYHRKLKTIKIVHTPAKLNNHVSLLFWRELKRIWNRLGGIKSPPWTFTERNETKRWSIRQGVNSPFHPRTVKTLTTGDESILETARLDQLTGIRKIKRKRKIRDLKTLKVKNPKRPKLKRQHGVIENWTLLVE